MKYLTYLHKCEYMNENIKYENCDVSVYVMKICISPLRKSHGTSILNTVKMLNCCYVMLIACYPQCGIDF